MQASQYKSIEVVCPLCGATKAVPVPLTLFSEKKVGHVKIQVPKGVACPEHVFIVFLDIQARIIGYETVDISISSLAKFEQREDGTIEDEKTISLREFIEIMGFQCFAGLIHAKLFNYPLYIIVEENFKVNLDVINNLLEDVMPDMYKNTRSLKTITYPGDIYPVATYFYALVKNKTKAAYLMNPKKQIVQMPWKTGLGREKMIINASISKENQTEQLKFLAFYITKFLEDVDKTVILLNDVKKSSVKDLVKKLQEIAITSTVTKDYIISIKEFIQRRISPEIAKKIND